MPPHKQAAYKSTAILLTSKDIHDIEKATKELASITGQQLSPKFRASLRQYLKSTAKQVPKIENQLGSKVTAKEVLWALTTIGKASVATSRARKGRVVSTTDLQSVLATSKALGAEILGEKMLKGPCPLPTCWSAAASLIYNARDLLNVKGSKATSKQRVIQKAS